MKKMGLARRVGTMLLCAMLVNLSGCGTPTSSDSEVEKENQAESVVLERIDDVNTEEQILEENDYEKCSSCIDDIYGEIDKYDNRGYSEEGDITTAVSIVSNLAEEWKEQGIVNEVNTHGSYVYIEFTSGIKYFYSPAMPGTSAAESDTQVSIYSLQPAKTEFAERNEETALADANATDGAAKKIADAYDDFSWRYNLDDKDVTCQTVADFTSDEVILWNGHGGYFEECGSTLVLSETINDVHYKGDYLCYIVNDGNYLITSDFVNAYLGDLSNTFLYLSTCSGLRDTGLVESFRNKGAAAIVANTDVITTIYTSNVMAAVVDGMVEGNTLDDAMTLAKQQYGECDSVFYEDAGALGYAVPTVYCGGDYMFDRFENLPDGTYQSDPTYTGSISDNMTSLTLDSAVWQNYNDWDWEVVLEKNVYRFRIAEDCKVTIYTYEPYTTSLEESLDRVNSFMNGSGLNIDFVIKDGEIIEFRLIS